MLTHPDFMLDASKEYQERLVADLRAARAAHAAHDHETQPGALRRSVGGALIALGEHIGGRHDEHQPAWTSTPTTTIHLA